MKLSWKKLVFPVFVFLVFPVAIAYAFSFSSLLHGVGAFIRVNTHERILNSQTLQLASVASAAGPELRATDTFADINIVLGSALLADAGPSGALADVENGDYNYGQISIYVVREGDTFSSIARMFDVSVNTILWANNLERGTKLTIGQTLVILPVSGVQYTVKRGDTIAGIAKKFKGDLNEIRTYNGIAEGDTLDIGSIVIVPDGELPTASAVSATSKPRNVGGPTYDGYYRAPFTSYRKTQGLHGYNGVDLAATRIVDGKAERWVGAPVMAAAGGEVIIARQSGYNGGYGNYVVIQHSNGTQTLYAHLKSVATTAGNVVFQGQVIGYEGSTGRSTGTHLHFEVRGAKNPF